MYKQLIEQAEKYIKSLNTEDNIAAQLKRMLADLMASGEANADAACRALLLSRRTLQRRLKTERTSFQKILQEVRAELAVRYLSDERQYYPRYSCDFCHFRGALNRNGMIDRWKFRSQGVWSLLN